MVRVLGGLVAGLATVVVVFLLGMRAKSPPVLGAVRRLNRRVLNPRQMRTAGTPGANASIVRHRGRTSGRAYETPVGATPVDGGFVIALPYGTQADWLKNVLAAGEATIVDEGQAFHVDRPELVAVAEIADALDAAELRTLRLFAVDRCLRVHTAATEDVSDAR